MHPPVHHSRRPQTYQVPERFGAGGMLAMMFTYSVTFAVLRHLDASWHFYLFLALLGLVVGVSQMRGGRNPRLASVIAGAVMLPPALFVASALQFGFWDTIIFIPGFLLSAVLGAGIGYMAGTLLGGAFLLADYLEQHFDPRRAAQADRSDSEVILALDITQWHDKLPAEPQPNIPPVRDSEPPIRF